MPKTQMLVNYVPGEECRIAIVEDGKLEEFYQERASNESHVSNIYKGRVANVEPAIQAAFVDFGLERNGFLHISDLHPKYFNGKDREEFEKVGQKTAHRDRPPMQKCLRRGDEVLVQVLKEGIGTKGPTLTSYLSIPGRFLVMMPDMQRLGVSRKIEDEDQRKELRDILKELSPPDQFGFIIRTAGIGQTKTDLKRDLAYLQRLWKNIEAKRKGSRKTGELYAESDLVIRTIRDVFSKEIDRIVVDDPSAARRASDFLSVANPRARSKVMYYDDPIPLLSRFGVEEQIEAISAREVPLPSGGSLVIDPTEALVAIDVNSGKSRDARDAESNAYNTNMEAVDEICRQLRLRDLGGVVVNDLIDMRATRHRKSIEQRFRNNLKKDRARTRIGSISQFGILEMTRQRMRPSLKSSLYNACHHCQGSGYTKSAESVLLTIMRRLAVVMHRPDVARCELTISPDVAFHLLNRKRHKLVELEQMHNKQVLVRVGGGRIDFVEIAAFDNNGGALTTDADSNLDHLPGESKTTFRDIKDISRPESAESEPAEEEPLIEDEADEEEDAQAPARDASRSGGKSDNRRRDKNKGKGKDKDKNDSKAQDDSSKDGQNENNDEGEDENKPRKRRRRRGGRGRRRSKGDKSEDQAGDQNQGRDQDQDSRDDGDDGGRSGEKDKVQAQSRDKPEASAGSDTDNGDDDGDSDGEGNNDGGGDGEGKKSGRRRRRRGGRRRRRKSKNSDGSGEQNAEAQNDHGDGDGDDNGHDDGGNHGNGQNNNNRDTEPDESQTRAKNDDNGDGNNGNVKNADSDDNGGNSNNGKRKSKGKRRSRGSRSKVDPPKDDASSKKNDAEPQAEAETQPEADPAPVSSGYSNRLIDPAKDADEA